ncbi:esterase/lipase family protein [Bifidobacterium oedipodis]|uniref:GPI inositol-deacylase PGAP1-like alpha/beta domain-containing protein n=1 Tax=Bifidobacterium oedipodis TaxID=2675322 RepID=A0A7Y0ENQ6_9BIFI|nr:alpha/beta hydrolase [Bifidobacterium sp. DSM 109957]NMM93650.1 hypothetical protein [Bifidobacterium sp. DSM 109957]
MSEHNDYWQVESSIHGGVGFAPATLEEYTAIAKALDDEAAGFMALAASWGSVGLQLQAHRTSAPMCPVLSSEVPSTTSPGHTTLPFASLSARCDAHAVTCRKLAEELSATAGLLIRAHSLYSEAELATRRIIGELLQAGTQAKPGYALTGTAAVAAGGLLAGWAIDGRPNPAWMSTFTAPLQEGVLSGVGAMVGGIPIGEGVIHTNEVNTAAGRIAGVSAPMKNLAQGDHLIVREVRANSEVVRASRSVGDSMENLRRLAEERLGKIQLNSGLEYGTIAIQRYERVDGSNAWLVTIPGTDGQPDSPFGWMQNVELTSADQAQRKQADSARMVAEAMRQAGIGADEPVALIGHSQGGIVAATLASDWADEYSIEHVVTAGSPVANHPIPSKTWVTSVEIEDELVVELDGAANPATDNWLTIRGHVSPAPAATEGSIDENGSCTPGATPIAGSTPYDAAPVAGATDGREISHWLKYHQAAYQNASDLGSPAVQRHEEHFQSIIAGQLKQTQYFEGRMTNAATLTPDRRHDTIDPLYR